MASPTKWKQPILRSTKALLWLIGVVTAIFLAAGLMLPPFPKLSEMSPLVVQMSRCKAIILMLHAYADDNNGNYPDDLVELVTKELLDKKYLQIDLRDGKAPVTWLYRKGLSIETPAAEWVVVSQPIVNTVVSARERKRQERAGGLQYPPEVPFRVVGRNDTVVEIMREEAFQEKLREHPAKFEAPAFCNAN